MHAAGEPTLCAQNNGKEVCKIMRQTAGQLSGKFAFGDLLQGVARLRFLGDIHRQDISAFDARFFYIRREGHANAPGAEIIGEFQHAWSPQKRFA